MDKRYSNFAYYHQKVTIYCIISTNITFLYTIIPFGVGVPTLLILLSWKKMHSCGSILCIDFSTKYPPFNLVYHFRSYHFRMRSYGLSRSINDQIKIFEGQNCRIFGFFLIAPVAILNIFLDIFLYRLKECIPKYIE